jgi:hypothetical protein
MRRERRFRAVLVCALVAAMLASRASAQDPHSPIDLAVSGTVPVPKTGTAAAQTVAVRQAIIVKELACRNELDFLHRVRSSGHEKSTGETINLVLAKMYWIAGMPDQNGRVRAIAPGLPCDATVTLAPDMIPKDDDPAPSFDTTKAEYGKLLQAMASASGALTVPGVNDRFAATFGAVCDSVVASVTETSPGTFRVGFHVTASCQRAQINKALAGVEVTGHLGTGKGMPCHLFGTLSDDDGNWDFSVRSLIRVLYLDRLTVGFKLARLSLLDPAVRRHVRNDLITTDIYLGAADYPLTGCGNTEHATGDAADRVDDDNILDDAADTIGDILDWLLKHWYLVYPAVNSLLPGLPVAVQMLIGAAETANAVIQTVRIPETENHRLMIESSRYLNNALLREDLVASGDDDRIEEIDDAQDDVRDWLLERMQEILRDDFSEYNSRPYQRESIGALMNLHDFAPDSEVRTAARLDLEYAFAKFAMGSNQGRRLPPFRRHMSAIVDPLEKGAHFLEPGSEADHQVALGLVYTGQTQQRVDGRVNLVVAPEAAFGAFSWYVPNKLVLDLAIDKSSPYFVRFRHDGFEAYSSGRGFLITAGGFVTDYASAVLGIGDANDIGAAVPTTVMLPSGKNVDTITSFLRFDGIRVKIEGALNDPQVSFDHNGCVAKGFACGMNVRIPTDMNGCWTPGPASREPFWFFFDSTLCAAYKDGPAVYMARYTRPCGAAALGCADFGFVEVIDVAGPATAASFAAFQSGVLARNAPALIPNPPAMVAGGGTLDDAVPLPSTYVTTDGRRIEFDVTEHILDEDRTGLKAVNGVNEPDWDDLPLASGDITQPDGSTLTLIDKNDWPLVHIRNPRFPGQAVTLDFRGRVVPKYDGPQ